LKKIKYFNCKKARRIRFVDLKREHIVDEDGSFYKKKSDHKTKYVCEKKKHLIVKNNKDCVKAKSKHKWFNTLFCS